MSNRVGATRCNLVICNRFKGIGKVLRSVDGPIHWISLTETLESRRLTGVFRRRPGMVELDAAKLRRNMRESFRERYIQFIGNLNRHNQSLAWWTLSPSTKNPDSNQLVWDVASFTLVADLFAQGYRNLIVVCDSPHLIAQLKTWGKCNNINVLLSSRIDNPLRFFFKNYTPASVVKSLINTTYRWLLCKRIKNTLDTDKPITMIASLTYQRSFDDSNDKYNDVYFGPLIDYLKNCGKGSFIASVIRGSLRSQIPLIKKLRTEIPIIPFEAFLTITDICWCWLVCLKYSCTSLTIKGDCLIGDQDIRVLVERAFREAIKSGDLVVSLRSYRACLRIGKTVNVDRCIYPYENRIWEKMLLIAFRELSPCTRMVGFQHAAISLGHLHFFLGEGENEVVPLPDVLLTGGDFTSELLNREGGYPHGMVSSGCALRVQNSVRHFNSSESNTILVAMGRGIEEYVRTLIALEGACHGLRCRNVVIRPHPNLSLQLESIINKGDIGVSYPHVISSEPLEDDLKMARVLVYASSTVALEAVVKGMPTICIDLGKAVDSDPMWALTDFKWTANDSEGLLKALTEIEELTDFQISQMREKANLFANTYLTPVTDVGLQKFLDI